jgi:hypothetical protein
MAGRQCHRVVVASMHGRWGRELVLRQRSFFVNEDDR